MCLENVFQRKCIELENWKKSIEAVKRKESNHDLRGLKSLFKPFFKES